MGKRGPKRRYTDEQVVDAVAQNQSLAGVLRDLGLVPRGGNYKTLRRRIRALNLDTSHWLGQGHLKGKVAPWLIARAAPLDQILVADSTHQGGSSLKQRLLRSDLLEPKCARCGLVDWQGEPIALHLDPAKLKDRASNDKRDRVAIRTRPGQHAGRGTGCGRSPRSSAC